MASTGKNILVHLKKCEKLSAARFTQCIIDYFVTTVATRMEISVELIDDKLIISDTKQTATAQWVQFYHPPFCPFHHLSTNQASEITEEIAERGINVGVSVLVESCDDKVLLSRRAAHLRTFPSIWVPPGGHVEENESLIEAGLRELEEEVGLHLEPDQFMQQPLKILTLWESCFPAKLEIGLPKRHHVVCYMYGKLRNKTSTELNKQVKMDANETDACVWLDKEIVEVIDLSREDITTEIKIPENIPETISALVFDDNKQQIEADLDVSLLFQRLQKADDKGRVSSGTKMALHQWLKLKT
ncbi:nucleoside diphosphate-linked moiety X motif 17 [Patella vulgata]|uniref:nucleoside diphosphate-linked moiety X motif 17 n=1 Tax=Patella vulgata TaxID=6465 RepID=UPI00217F4E50|nr:nucleoside diphosphate-linked moiety X motif 17 [Patella vulgata]XP_050401029.1 nucleoside diphosphate-linked moiety X motif 17 [Patella vulgata]XP_050401030.1 nucleoside diphosphate-linked moiety X motif 17 [Patella vulgata]XP_050401031.1 nucleoside diphosphate-linked moiety X motif 17 [Patella vulgata]